MNQALKVWLALNLFLGFAWAKTCPSDQKVKQVLLLFSYHVTQPMEDGFTQGIREHIDSNHMHVDMHFEYMDSKRYPPPTLDSVLTASLTKKYSNQCFDAVIPADNIALEYTLKIRPFLFDSVPLLFLGINNYSDSLLQGNKNITGVAEDIDIPGTFDLVKKLLDSAKTIYLLHDLGETGLRLRKETEKYLALHPSWKPIWLDSVTYEQIYETVRNPSIPAPMIVLTFSRDLTGRTLGEIEFHAKLGQATAIPIFVLLEHQVQNGIIGGSLTSGRQHGLILGKMLQQLLRGTPADSIPILKQSPKYAYVSYPSLVKFGINPRNVPKNVHVGQIPFSPWVEYQNTIFAVMFVIAIMIIGILVLLRMRSQLHKSRQEYRDLVNHSDTIIIRWGPDGTIDFINEYGCNLFGYKMHELLGKTLLETIVPRSDASGQDMKVFFDQFLQRPEAFEENENENSTKSGSRLWIRWFNRPMYNKLGKLDCIFSVGTNVTEKRLRDIEINDFNNKVTHDLRTPLVTISSFAGMIQQDLKDGDHDAVLKDLEYIQHSATKMSAQLDELSQLTRLGKRTNKQERFILEDSIEEARKLVAGRFELAKIQFHCTAKGFLTGDRNRIVGVFQNLFDNAAKHMGNQSHPKLEVSIEKHKGRNVIAIRDNGKGIPQHLLERIFDVFYKIDNKIEGTGLGLSLVRKMIETYGGRIWAESEGEGKGSTFYLMLDHLEC